jgi:hypothetical protein
MPQAVYAFLMVHTTTDMASIRMRIADTASIIERVEEVIGDSIVLTTITATTTTAATTIIIGTIAITTTTITIAMLTTSIITASKIPQHRLSLRNCSATAVE